jgi:hypothetical protein
MKIYTTPRDWLFLTDNDRLDHNVNMQIFKNNPDCQWDINLCGFWIRPKSKLWTFLTLKGIDFHLIFQNTTGQPDWRDHD